MNLMLKHGLKIDKLKLYEEYDWKNREWIRNNSLPLLKSLGSKVGTLFISHFPNKGYEGGGFSFKKFKLPLMTVLLLPEFGWKHNSRILLFVENIRMTNAENEIYGLLDKLVPNGLAGLRKDSLVEYIETPLDILGHPDALVIWVKSTIKSFLKGLPGSQTVYFSQSGSKCQIKYYLKCIHLGIKGHPQKGPILRIEAGVKGPLPFSQLSELANPYANLLVFERSQFEQILSTCKAFAMFFHDYQTLGFEQAYKHLAPHRKKKLQEILEPSTPAWAVPSTIWSDWKNVLTGYNLLRI